ncbi:DNA-binding pseudobarrel domain-containing protein [Tanacetum coccineum]
MCLVRPVEWASWWTGGAAVDVIEVGWLSGDAEEIMDYGCVDVMYDGAENVQKCVRGLGIESAVDLSNIPEKLRCSPVMRVRICLVTGDASPQSLTMVRTDARSEEIDHCKAINKQGLPYFSLSLEGICDNIVIIHVQPFKARYVSFCFLEKVFGVESQAALAEARVGARSSFSEAWRKGGGGGYTRFVIGRVMSSTVKSRRQVRRAYMIPEDVVIRSATGGFSWNVKMKKIGQSVCFDEGWSKVVEDARFGYEDMLVFWFVGESTFKMWIYGPINGCEKILLPQTKHVKLEDDALLAML